MFIKTILEFVIPFSWLRYWLGYWETVLAIGMLICPVNSLSLVLTVRMGFWPSGYCFEIYNAILSFVMCFTYFIEKLKWKYYFNIIGTVNLIEVY